MSARAMPGYRETPADPEGVSPVLDALADAVCHLGGHIPNRDRSLPGSCEFHRRMAAGYLRVIAEAAAS